MKLAAEDSSLPRTSRVYVYSLVSNVYFFSISSFSYFKLLISHEMNFFPSFSSTKLFQDYFNVAQFISRRQKRRRRRS